MTSWSDPIPSQPGAIVIIGAGIAGVGAAGTLRDGGFTGTITLIGDEPDLPYDHVPLSKHHLMGEEGFHPLFLHPESWYADHDIDLRRGTTAVDVDPVGRYVGLASGERLPYDRLLLATGSSARHLGVPGADLGGVHHLRTLHDAEVLSAELRGADRVVVVGDGFIGCEVAAAARTLGAEVALVGRGPVPMSRALGDEMAGFFRDAHLAHGVELWPGRQVVELRGDGHGQVDAVVLDDTTTTPADVVVVGIGAVPRSELAEVAGITTDERGGVLVDEFLGTGTSGVFAAGDVAAVFDPSSRRHVRHEHWATALHQGPTAARNMLGRQVAFDHTPFFFTDQYDIWMEYTGVAGPDDELVVRGDPDDGEHAEFIAFWLNGDRVTAVINVNIRGIPTMARELIRSGRPVDRSALVDPTVPFEEL